MTILQEWVTWSINAVCAPTDHFWSGARMIVSDKVFSPTRLDDSISMEDIGFTEYKLTRLHGQYFVDDSVETAMMLHQRNVDRRKYASAAFHCYGHLLKSDPDKKSKRASVMGPCIQSVVMTVKPHKNLTECTVVYRTTEVFKKFPADLVWLRERVAPLIPGQDRYPLQWRFQFINATLHPMYFPAVLPYLPSPTATFEKIRHLNPTFWEWSGKWLARYLIGGAAGRSIEKFAQAQRTAKATIELIPFDKQKELVHYLAAHRESFSPKRTRFDSEELSKAFDDALRRVG